MSSMFKTSTMDATGQFDLGTVEGTRAWETYHAERRKLLFTQVEPGSREYYISTYEKDNIFNVYPVLKALTVHDPREILVELDKALEDLSIYYTDGGGEGTSGSGYRLMVLRTIRNAFMSGIWLFTFDDFLEEQCEKTSFGRCSMALQEDASKAYRHSHAPMQCLVKS